MIIESLETTLAPIEYIPLRLIPSEQQENIRNILRDTIAALYGIVRDATPNEKHIWEDKFTSIIEYMRGELFDEYLPCTLLNNVLEATYTNNKEQISLLMKLLRHIDERGDAYTAVVSATIEESESVSGEVRVARDTELIKTEMHVYALDYFLYMWHCLVQNPDQAQRYILGKVPQSSLPSLYEDAMNEDMLKKIAYNIQVEGLRNRMIDAFYVYKKSFISLDPSQPIRVEDATGITCSLKDYCLHLLAISTEYGVDTVHFSMYMPWKAGTPIQDISHNIALL